MIVARWKELDEMLIEPDGQVQEVGSVQRHQQDSLHLRLLPNPSLDAIPKSPRALELTVEEKGVRRREDVEALLR